MNTELLTGSRAPAQGQRLSTNSALEKDRRPPGPQAVRIRIDLGRDARPGRHERTDRPPQGAALAPASPLPPLPSVQKSEPSVLEIKLGSSTLRFPYYKTAWQNKSNGRTYRSFTLAWHDGRKRKREKRSSFKALRARAEEVAKSIVNGETAMLEFTQADKASYLRAKELLCSVQSVTGGKQLEMAVAEYAEAQQLLSGVSLIEAVRYYVAQHPNGAAARTIPIIVAEMFEKRKMSTKWKRILGLMLDRFSKHFTGPFQNYTTRDFDDWLDGLKDKKQKKLSLRSRQNYRDAILSVVNFAQSRGDVPRDWQAVKETAEYEPESVDVNLYTPDELTILLNKAETYKAGQKLVPLVAITAFAGVRHGEMNEEKVRLLDWEDFDWEAKTIYVGKGAAKTGRDRVVDMPDNLIAWLQPYVKRKGRVCDLTNTSNALARLRQKAGITGNKRNALRKSFISYKKAITQDIAHVADQAGNSAGIIRKNYLRSDTRMKKAAERWFTISPTRADVLPLFNWKAA